MKRYSLIALSAMVIAGCSTSDITSPSYTPPTKKPDTPAVQTPPAPVTFDRSNFSIRMDESLDLGARATNPSGLALSWATSDASVATVSNGVVTPKGFGVVSVSVTPSGGTATEVKIWVGRLPSLFSASTQGCPSAAEVAFVTAAIPYINVDGDTTTAMCSGDGVAMTKVRAATYRGIANLASLRMDSMPWATGSRNLFEWFAFDSKLAGIHFVSGIKATGECCENVDGKWGVILYNVNAIDKTYDVRAMASFVSVLLHEARHIVFGAHKCFANGGVIDSTITEMGPYATEYLFTKWLSTSNLLSSSDQVREAAYVENVRKGSFCTPPSP